MEATPADSGTMQIMCGRFVQSHDAAFYADAFQIETIRTGDLPVSFNVAPTDEVYAVAEHEGERHLGSFRWGLIPSWAKDRKIGARNINARMESIADKPAFRDSFRRRRCLIPADGFYEWQRLPKGKLPHYIYRIDRKPLALAGLWANWKDPETGEWVRTCTIITGTPNSTVAELHDRMPVILPEAVWADWLDRDNQDRELLDSLMKVYPAGQLTEHPVATLVNKVANNFPECIEPLETAAAEQLTLDD
jgi:putative SOS response-associated peptidase YedK